MSNTSSQEHTINKDSVSFSSYQEMSEHYFKYVDTKPFNAYDERPATISLLPDVKGKQVLDAGCAAGWYTKWLLDNDADVIAVDFSPNMIEITKKRVGNNAKIIRADLNDSLDFIKDKSIDIVLSSLTFHYLKTWNKVMSEFNRVLKDGGQLIFNVLTKRPQFLFIRAKKYQFNKLLLGNTLIRNIPLLRTKVQQVYLLGFSI